MKTVVFDIEANGLSPDKVWFIVCRDVDTGEENVFIPSTGGPNNFEEFRRYALGVDTWVGHYILGFDVPVLDRLCPGWASPSAKFLDTLIVSKLLDTNINGGHSIEAWGERLGQKKAHADIADWSQPTEEMLERCISDVSVNVLLYKKFLKYLSSELWAKAIEVEHFIAARCQELHENGFHFSLDKAKSLWYTIDQKVKELDVEIQTAFPPRPICIREIVPRLTTHGTLNRNDFRWAGPDLTEYNGGPFSRIDYQEFNAGSPTQIVERLNEAGWVPTEKTKGHNLALREKKDLERKGLWSKEKQERLDKFAIYGWTVSEENLLTLPETAPPAAKTLASRIMLASRLRTLTEWINAYNHETCRVHGSFSGIGAWTHRMSHSNPNTGNIAREDALYGAEMRSMWCTPEGSFLVGVDAESIQLRVLAHYINDDKFTQSLLTGKKEDGTDPHSLNKIALGSICPSRNHAKTFNDWKSLN